MYFTGAWSDCPNGDCSQIGIGCTADKEQACAYGSGSGRGCTGGDDYFSNYAECGACYPGMPKKKDSSGNLVATSCDKTKCNLPSTD